MPEYMIHTCNSREWYVDDYLVPSMVEQGISRKDITVWRDKNSEGNLASFVNSCKWIAENKPRDGAIWHLQDDVVISERFFPETQKEYPGLACGFCNETFDAERTNYFGTELIPAMMWFSFQCVRIPNMMAAGFVDWLENNCIPNHLYDEYVESGKCDDSLFRFYVTENYPDHPAYNIFPNIVDHIDYLVGGTTINHQRIGEKRVAIWRDHYLDDAVVALEQKLKNRDA